jgi:lysozyme family protein
VKHFLIAWGKTHAVEKGYSKHPSDPGEETMHGVTAKVARAFGYTGPMKDLPYEKATEIAKLGYWDPFGPRRLLTSCSIPITTFGMAQPASSFNAH